MKAYLIIDLTIVDMDGFMSYVQAIPELIAKHGGHYQVEGVVPVLVTGGAAPERTVVIEFPDRQAAEAFLAERAASKLKEVFESSTHSRILLVEGVS